MRMTGTLRERIGAAFVLAALVLAGASLAHGDEYHRVRCQTQDIEAYDDLTYWTTPIATLYTTSDGYISISPLVIGHAEYHGELECYTRNIDTYAIHPLTADDERVPLAGGELVWVIIHNDTNAITFVFRKEG